MAIPLRVVGAEPPIVITSDSTPESDLPTVAELLELPELAGVRLLTSLPAAGLRRVRRTSVQELPLDDFVRPGELVMTTGMGLGDPDRLTAFVRDIARAGAAGLAIAIGPHVSTIPESTILEAERLGLLLFEMPWELRFSEVTERVLDHVVDRQHDRLRRSERIHELFTRIVLSGGDLARLCRFLESQIGCAVRIVDRWGEVTEAGPGSLAAASPGDWTSGVAIIPIAAERKPLGTLLVRSAQPVLGGLDAMVAQHAATAAALIMLMQRAEAEGEARGQSELLIAVLNGTSGSPRELERRAVALGFDPQSPFAVLHVSLASSTLDSDLAELARWAVQRAMAARRTNALQAWDGSDVTILLPDAPGRASTRIRGLIEDITVFARRQDAQVSVTCGIGRVARNLAAVRDSFQEAAAACRLGGFLHGSGSTTEYADLGPYPALFAALNGPASAAALDALEERYLGAAARYEDETGLPLIETLTCLFDELGNVSATARSLRINRQSLLYRLERFQVIADVDLSSPVDRFALELALRCWRMRAGPTGDLSVSTGAARP